MLDTWYEASYRLLRIKPLPIERFTESFVWVSGRRQSRYTEGGCVCPTYNEARQRLIDEHERREGRAASMLAVRQADLKRARELPEEYAQANGLAG
jgi:hypothetical protein